MSNPDFRDSHPLLGTSGPERLPNHVLLIFSQWGGDPGWVRTVWLKRKHAPSRDNSRTVRLKIIRSCALPFKWSKDIASGVFPTCFDNTVGCISISGSIPYTSYLLLRLFLLFLHSFDILFLCSKRVPKESDRWTLFGLILDGRKESTNSFTNELFFNWKLIWQKHTKLV